MHDTIPLAGRTAVDEGDLRLPRPPGVIRRYWARHPWVTDSIVAGLYLIVSLIFLAVQPDMRPGWTTPVALGISVISAAALLFRRHRPFTVLFISWATTLALSALTTSLDSLSMLFALYAIAVYRSTKDAWIGFAGSLIVGTIAAYLTRAVGYADSIEPYGANAPATSSQFGIVMLIAVLIGINVGNRKRYVEALVARAQQLARERDQQAIIAAASERARIAREMHDIVSHSLTVMVTLADGAEAIIGSAPDRASDAMHRVADTGRTALTDMRRMLGVLGSNGDAELAPQPGAGDLESLLETYRAAGLPVTLTTSGVPGTDSTAQLVEYRIVQESLTNVLRHAVAPSEVRVDIRHDSDATRIEVSNDGRLASPSQSGGHGLLGMRERVVLYGGTLDAGPRPAGGWAVRAVLPRDDANEIETPPTED